MLDRSDGRRAKLLRRRRAHSHITRRGRRKRQSKRRTSESSTLIAAVPFSGRWLAALSFAFRTLSWRRSRRRSHAFRFSGRPLAACARPHGPSLFRTAAATIAQTPSPAARSVTLDPAARTTGMGAANVKIDPQTSRRVAAGGDNESRPSQAAGEAMWKPRESREKPLAICHAWRCISIGRTYVKHRPPTDLDLLLCMAA